MDLPLCAHLGKILDINLLTVNPTWICKGDLNNFHTTGAATAAGSYCCIINGLTSTVCAETNHTVTIMRSQKLALNMSEWAWNQVTRSNVSVLAFWWNLEAKKVSNQVLR